MTQLYEIEGMRCSSCIQKLTTALEEVADNVTVTLDPPRAVLQSKKVIALDLLNATVSKAGPYKLTPLAQIKPIPQQTGGDEETKSWLQTYYPLLLIISFISIASLKGAPTFHDWMLHFMAGFFIVFGFFKLLDLKGFRDAYATYDLLAQRWYDYGLIYPFLEISLGFMFLFQYQLTLALGISIALMTFSGLGVITALSKKQKIRCACLGTVLNLPMSTVTLIEDLSMVIMSIAMLAGAR